MATRKSNQPADKATPARQTYATTPLEDRVRLLEKRSRKSDLNKTWEISLTRRLTISLVLYVTAAMIFAMLLLPNWYACAVLPVSGYWLGSLSLWLMRDLWETNRLKR